MSAHALAKIPARHALRYSIPIAFVGFPTYPHAPSSLSALNPFSLLASLSFSLFMCFLFSSLSFSLSLFVSSRTYIHMHGILAARTRARLVEGLLPVRAEISVRKFRSLAASESTTKLDINLPNSPDAILCPSVLFRFSFRFFLSLDTNHRLALTRNQASYYGCLLQKIVKRTK